MPMTGYYPLDTDKATDSLNHCLCNLVITEPQPVRRQRHETMRPLINGEFVMSAARRVPEVCRPVGFCWCLRNLRD